MEVRKFRRVLQEVMVVPIASLLLLAFILIVQMHSALATVGGIEASDLRIQYANLVQRLVVDEETGLRGYQITSDRRFLDPYREAEGPLASAVQQLRDTFGSETSPDLDGFVAEHAAWRAGFAEPMIAAVGAGLPTRDDDINLTGRARMDAMRTHLNAITQRAARSRADRIARWQMQVRHTLYALALLAFAVGLFLALFTRDRLEMVSMAFRLALDLQRRRAQELFESEQHLRTTLASIGDGVITCDRAGHILTMNTVAQQLTGWTESEARSRPLDEVFPIVNETSRNAVESPVARVQRLNRIVGLANHTLLIRRDGSEIAIDDSGAPIRSESGELTGVVLVFRDITMERRTRAALLANEKLAVAGRLAATIAHEIHNPLDSVSNILYLLQQGVSPEESRQFLDLAQTELARVTQISRAMLSLYRESKAPVAIDIKETLEDILLLMERRFHSLEVQVDAELPTGIVVEGFPAELRQVFTNLLTNAAEAAAGGGRIAVRVRAVAAEPGSAKSTHGEPGALIEIEDSGAGITPEVHERLFQPFFTTKGERGTGLGLWVCQGIIRKHGGTLTLENRPDCKGAIASVFLATKSRIDPGAL